ncbi:MAG TPA: phosphoenolpyruvate carboxykinase (GTP) [Candidatus Marinimicrobia bacterium]|nr:phosphoenolpyruvate carboxykinase (GTP) [Candidatus Neomarinimicrobiota bacterium]HRS52386.1 phosphoenolpyruvate carboxykinase (GTP) [Candidatus Neomarinimicrobiota bacterium]HRU93272.1 phosphoenolpyruvate carboxykinase (GTP) [Candidatus Neomarinimicrobiota bacterium]
MSENQNNAVEGNPFPDCLSTADWQKLTALQNRYVEAIVTEYIRLCRPSKVSILSDTPEEIAYVRQLALRSGEEQPLKTAGHTVHFDGYNDQGRDKENTRILVSDESMMSERLNTLDRARGLAEIRQLLDGIMTGKEMLVRFYCLGPLGSIFSIPALQITDSSYVAHSEDLLYRQGYGEFRRLNGSDRFFHFIHSSGELDERGCSKNIDKRRIYIDLEGNRVFTINNQYAGNSVGLKKLALRLAINKANHEDWLAEHMFIMGVHPPQKERTTYFTGAFPSACGKTSTAMLPGQTIVGDDIAYLRVSDDKNCRAVNIESGIFGIIADVNPIDDALIYRCLTTPRELIFSNVLVKDGKPYWLGMGCETPDSGINHSGEWFKGKKDANGKEIPLAHKNARYTMRLSELENLDPRADDPNGVPISAIIYGGRDSDTNPPILQARDWLHGVMLGATLESETTAATLGQEGKRTFSPMANLDFVVVPLGLYIENHLKFGARLSQTPLVFATNYFLKDGSGNYLNEKTDKKVWILWAEGRVHNEYDAIATPVGYLPKYDDLQKLFKTALGKDYSRTAYEQQFTLRIDKFIAKLDRVSEFYRNETVPSEFKTRLVQQRADLVKLQEEYQAPEISPFQIIKR